MSNNPLFGAMGGGNTPTMAQLLEQIKTNPMQVLGRRFNIPQGVNLTDPNSILNYLVRTGQISQERYNAAFQQAQQLCMK